MRRQATYGPRWQSMGVNYGSDVAYDNPFNEQLVRTDLLMMKHCFSRIRIFIPNTSISARVRDNCLRIASIAKGLGFKVVWGCTANPSVLTASNWQTYRDYVVQRAQLAESYGIDEFTLGNEDEYRIDGTTLSIGIFRSNIISLAADVKQVFSGDISYTVSHNHTFGWISIGKHNLGSLDKLGLNVYGSHPADQRYFIYILSTFYKEFGSAMYISEFNITDNWADAPASEHERYVALKTKIDYIRRTGVNEAYYFIFSHRSTDQFSLKRADGTYSAMWKALSHDSLPQTRASAIRAQSPIRHPVPQ